MHLQYVRRLIRHRTDLQLVGTDYNKIVNEVSSLIDDKAAYEKMSKAVNPYGRLVKI